MDYPADKFTGRPVHRLARPQIGWTGVVYVFQNQILAVQCLVISSAESDDILEREELDELDKDFKSFIQPHLSDKDPEDYDIVWQWQKFLFEKSQRTQPSGKR